MISRDAFEACRRVSTSTSSTRSKSERETLCEIGKQLGIDPPSNYELWYQVKYRDITGPGAGLLQKYGSVSAMVRTIFSEHKWDPAKFLNRPKNYWLDKNLQREFLIEMGRAMGFRDGDMTAWYSVRQSDFAKHGGRGLLKRHGESPRVALMEIFPEHDWEPWRFSSNNYEWFWRDANAIRAAIDKVEKSLGLSPSRWATLTLEQLSALGLGGIIKDRTALKRFIQLAEEHRLS